MNYILAYWEAIESGKVVTSRRVRAVYKRLAREIQEPDPDSPYYFDEEIGERPIIFAERFCKQSLFCFYYTRRSLICQACRVFFVLMAGVNIRLHKVKRPSVT